MHSATTIVTFSGKKIDFLNLSINDIDIIDIAKGLSNECRFGGQCESFYSVAQHSVLVSYLTPVHLALEGLLHDATEAYIKDFPSPLKKCMPQYINLEKEIESLIRVKFNISSCEASEVKHADRIMLATEARDLGMEKVLDYPSLRDISPSVIIKVVPMLPKAAFSAFLERFAELIER
ncbi:TPA: HD family hydrolase [Enterobacter ludwigii]